jgi:nucleotide-binding universal stress UspA family protein
MTKPQRILLTTDLSPTSVAAIEPATMLARAFHAQILLLYVGQPPPQIVNHPGFDYLNLEKHQLEQAREDLRRFAEVHIPGDIGVERCIALGAPYLEILRFADDHKVDLIVMATHGRGFFSHAMIGSTTERVIRRANCPVLAVRDRDAKEG